MEVGILVAAVAIVAFIAGFAVRGRSSVGPIREPGRGEPAPGPPGATSAQLIATLKDTAPVEELIWQGKKINAIKEFRAQTGCGLKEAKDPVEAMEREIAARPS